MDVRLQPAADQRVWQHIGITQPQAYGSYDVHLQHSTMPAQAMQRHIGMRAYLKTLHTTPYHSIGPAGLYIDSSKQLLHAQLSQSDVLACTRIGMLLVHVQQLQHLNCWHRKKMQA